MIKFGKFEVTPSRFKIDYMGKHIPIGDLITLNRLYHIMELAEYILNNYEYGEQDAWNIASTAYNYIERLEYDNSVESEAIYGAIKIFEENKKYEE